MYICIANITIIIPHMCVFVLLLLYCVYIYSSNVCTVFISVMNNCRLLLLLLLLLLASSSHFTHVLLLLVIIFDHRTTVLFTSLFT